MKYIRVLFLFEHFQFLAVKFSIYLNRRVFVINFTDIDSEIRLFADDCFCEIRDTDDSSKLQKGIDRFPVLVRSRRTRRLRWWSIYVKKKSKP